MAGWPIGQFVSGALIESFFLPAGRGLSLAHCQGGMVFPSIVMGKKRSSCPLSGGKMVDSPIVTGEMAISLIFKGKMVVTSRAMCRAHVVLVSATIKTFTNLEVGEVASPGSFFRPSLALLSNSHSAEEMVLQSRNSPKRCLSVTPLVEFGEGNGSILP